MYLGGEPPEAHRLLREAAHATRVQAVERGQRRQVQRELTSSVAFHRPVRHVVGGLDAPALERRQLGVHHEPGTGEP